VDLRSEVRFHILAPTLRVVFRGAPERSLRALAAHLTQRTVLRVGASTRHPLISTCVSRFCSLCQPLHATKSAYVELSGGRALAFGCGAPPCYTTEAAKAVGTVWPEELLAASLE
jgi:hypothetical protein